MILKKSRVFKIKRSFQPQQCGKYYSITVIYKINLQGASFVFFSIFSFLRNIFFNLFKNNHSKRSKNLICIQTVCKHVDAYLH